jgi:hypothetical protein
MKRLVAIALGALLLVPLMAGPADAWRGWYGRGCCWGGFAVGAAAGVLATAPFRYPRAYAYPVYPYPAYAYPAYSYPAYGYPPAYPYPAYSYPAYPPAPTAPPTDPNAAVQPGQATSLSVGTPPSPPTAASPAPAPGQTCETVTVEGHNETRTGQNGQTVTVWVPAHTQQLCQ